jgi:hypothetical protein
MPAVLTEENYVAASIPLTIITVDINPKWTIDPSRFRNELKVGHSVGLVYKAAARTLAEQPGRDDDLGLRSEW